MVSVWSGSGVSSLLGCRRLTSRVLTWQKERGIKLSVILIKALILFMRASPRDLISSNYLPKPRFLTSHWVTEFQQVHWGRTQMLNPSRAGRFFLPFLVFCEPQKLLS